MRGRPKVPTEVKKLKGTAQKCRILENEMQLTMSTEQPTTEIEFKSPIAKKVFDEMCMELKKINMLVGVDLGIIAMYSETMANYYEAVKVVEKQGMVIETDQGPKVNPWFTTKQNLVKQAMQLGQLIGVTPSARARIPNNNAKPVSKLELLKKKSA
jgi:P27 family predicted phage terminase small subunit